MRLKSVLVALGIAMAMVVSLDYLSFAAKGRSFLLGKVNVAAKQTSLVRTGNGPALGLYSKAGYAPLYVNRPIRVPNLNADRVDGYDSSALRNRSYVFTRSLMASTSNLTMSLPLPAGSYLVSYSAFLPGAASGEVGCWIGRTVGGTTTHLGENRFNAGTATPGLTGTALVSKGAGVTVSVNCSAANSFVTSGDQPVQVVATRMDVVSNASARPVR